ncbi:MAG TPA: AarF/UbiB family protein [Verrucomicrobiae bacterium]|jgi:predicted unusual protein kinase regulating ubiquinone biosynthesis (AarF/ABC1/UbiB family)
MTLSLRPSHVRRYAEIGKLLWKYSRSDIFRTSAFANADGDLPATNGKGAQPEDLADDLEAMGPTFVKLGQILSSRPDLLPAPYVKALSRLQDNVKPFSFADVERIVQMELGVRISKGFSFFDSEPLAAASLGQVHRAVLRDGRKVVVKVQRPGIRERIAEDFEVVEEIVEFLKTHTKLTRRYQFDKILDEFQRTLLNELDYQREAGNLRLLAENLKEFPRIRIPLPVADYTTRSVLTMEYVSGQKITDLSPLKRIELDGAGLAEELFRAYLKQVLADGLFHADPHPGNVYVTDCEEIALLDLGMVGRIAPGMQEKLIRLLLAVAEGRSDEAGTIAIQISETSERFDETEFRRNIALLISEQKDSALAEIQVGSVLLDVSRSAADTGLYAPSELSLLGKTLLQLDQVGRTLDPKFDPNAAIRRNVSEILHRRLTKTFTTGNMLSSVLELKDFVGGLPPKLNRIMDALGDPKLELYIRPRDKHQLLAGLNHSANRITAGLLLASLIVGAALLMRVPTEFQLFGYPGLAIICFLAAAAGGIFLLVNIVLQDRKHKKRAHELWQ